MPRPTAKMRSRLRHGAGRLVRRLGLVPAGQPDGRGEDATHEGSRFVETVLAIYPDAPTNLYQLRLWLPALERLNLTLPTGIVVQDSRVAAALRRETALTVYVLARYATFEAMADRGQARLALYPAHHTRNFQIMRRADLAHVYLGHGESDKAVSASNQLKAYDFSFASGQSAVDRAAVLPFYDAAQRMIIIGRPQLDELERGLRPGDDRTTVLYAPTWEGDQASMRYGSLVDLGPVAVAGLRAAGFRVIFRPHPRTGLSDPGYAAADRAVRHLVHAAAEAAPGLGHRVSTSGDVINDFNRADLLLCDVSSLVVDWLPTGRPLVVTKMPSTVEEDSPALSSIPRLRLEDDPMAVVNHVLDEGVDAEERAQLVSYYLGGDSSLTLAEACAEVISRHSRARSQASGHRDR